MVEVRIELRLHRLDSYSSAAYNTAIPVICTDNDTAGTEFSARCLKRFPTAILNQPDRVYKDWNDQLLKLCHWKSYDRKVADPYRSATLQRLNGVSEITTVCLSGNEFIHPNQQFLDCILLSLSYCLRNL